MCVYVHILNESAKEFVMTFLLQKLHAQIQELKIKYVRTSDAGSRAIYIAINICLYIHIHEYLFIYVCMYINMCNMCHINVVATDVAMIAYAPIYDTCDTLLLYVALHDILTISYRPTERLQSSHRHDGNICAVSYRS